MKTRKNDAITNIGGYGKEIFDSLKKFVNTISATFDINKVARQLQKTIDKTSKLSGNVLRRYFRDNQWEKNHESHSKRSSNKESSQRVGDKIQHGSKLLEFASKLKNGLKDFVDWSRIRKPINKTEKRLDFDERLSENRFRSTHRYGVFKHIHLIELLFIENTFSSICIDISNHVLFISLGTN